MKQEAFLATVISPPAGISEPEGKVAVPSPSDTVQSEIAIADWDGLMMEKNSPSLMSSYSTLLMSGCKARCWTSAIE